MSPRSRKNALSQFNVMVVGYSGVGKTSFVRTLVEALKLEMSKERRDSFIKQSTETKNQLDGPLCKTSEPYTVTVDVEVAGEKMALTLIDTPGFQTDYLVDKQLHDILGYIEHQFDLALAEENKVKRNPKAVDTQVHACLYFIDPTKRSLGEYDIRILTRLSKRVNVIPVIGKADMLTRAQRNRLKPAILQSIYTEHKIPLYGMPAEEEEGDEEEEEEGEENGADEGEKKMNGTTGSSLEEFLQQFNYEEEDEESQAFIDYLQLVPFTVIAYEDDPVTGRPVEVEGTEGIKIGRDYGWGSIDCMNDRYSDFNQLKDILLTTHRGFLKTETVERYYEEYRTERLLIKRATKMKSMDLSKKILEDLTQI
ncbi:hypothetical protein DFQ28_006443 [Apophysomyces sp. BC1034]|nr:hypothetical protein DFQ30_006882 [Apophysomyces sp. BC1015]KAG0177073.1 hypothetical protein DFQ29_005294 [Apophysomyces sp. BC1021]KAG0187359.1 hypothetical protein DFQ28_006443 [Apophysomyces sp. BC1034]